MVDEFQYMSERKIYTPKRNILFIVCSFTKWGSQSYRFQNIINILKSSYNVHVLEVNHNNSSSVLANGFWVHSVEFSWIGKLLHSKKNPLESNNNLTTKFKIRLIKARFKKNIHKIFFPDTFIFEKKRLNHKIYVLIEKYKFEIIIASGFPFTTMILSKTVKKNYPNLNFIYDIGDPFYKNALNGSLKDILARYFERRYLKHIDKLIVTNEATKNHYLLHFNDVIKKDQIFIVQQGVPNQVLQTLEANEIYKEAENSQKNELILVYAGQLYFKFRDPFQLYEAINSWNKQIKTKTLRLILYGAISDVFKPVQKSNSYINFKGRVSNQQVIEGYFRSDIIVFLDNAFGLQTPGKIFEVAAIGKPVLFVSDHKNSPAYEIVKDFKHIYFCENKKEKIIDTLKIINLKVNNEIIQNIRTSFSWFNRAKQFIEIIEC